MKNLKNNSRTKEQFNRMSEAEKLDICPFCEKGLAKIHKMPIEKETKDFFVTKNAFPYNGTLIHYLIIPKKHIKDIEELKLEMWMQIGELFGWIREYSNTNSGGFFLRFGDMHKTGSSVEHLHFQVISGSKSDTEDNKESIKVKFGYK